MFLKLVVCFLIICLGAFISLAVSEESRYLLGYAFGLLVTFLIFIWVN